MDREPKNSSTTVIRMKRMTQIPVVLLLEKIQQVTVSFIITIEADLMNMIHMQSREAKQVMTVNVLKVVGSRRRRGTIHRTT